MAGIILLTLVLLFPVHGQEVLVGTAPPIATLPPARRCQPPDTQCASSFNDTGECVDMATVDAATLSDLYDLSAGAINNICGPQTSSLLSCCRCLSAASCSHPRCVPTGSRDRRCFQPARDVKEPGWFKVGVCDRKTNCDCLELCKNRRCDQARGKCLLPEDPKPEGWTRAFICNRRQKCSCFVPPCRETNRCTTAGGRCFKRGSAPQGSTFLGNYCNSRVGCYCYKPTVEDCEQTKECADAINGGKCYGPGDPVPVGALAVPGVCRDECKCYGKSCSPTKDCLAGGGKCYRKGTEPRGSVMTDNTCDPNNDCYCYKPKVQDCEQTKECAVAIKEGKCYGPGEIPPVGTLGVPGVCKDKCICYGYGKGCLQTKDCLAGGGKCYRKGSEPTGSVMTDNTCDPNIDCYCYKPTVQDCEQTEKCADAIEGGKCYGPRDPVPVGAMGVPGVCKDECRCYGNTKDCEQTEECAAAIKGGKCHGPGDPVPAGAVGVPGVCKEDCKCYGFSIISGECSLTKDCFIGGGKCYKRGTEPPRSERIDRECNPNNDCFCYKPVAQDCEQTEECQTAITGGRCYGPGDLIPAGSVGVPDVCEDGCKCYGFKIISTFG